MFVAVILYLYIFFISWVGAFTLGEWFPLHVILLLTAGMFYLPKLIMSGKIPRNIYHTEDIFLCIGLAALTISGLIHPNEKTLNYLMAYFYVFGIGYLLLKLLLYKNTSVEKLLVVNAFAVLFVAVFAFMELLSNKFFGIDVQEYIPRVKPATAMYNMVFPRSYGFATEPTILAYYFNTLGPLALWQLWKFRYISNITKCCLTAVAILGWLCTFSAAGMVFMPLSIFIILVIKFLNTAITGKKVLCRRNSRSDANLAQTLSASASPAYNSLTAKNKLFGKIILIFILVFLLFFSSIKYFEAIPKAVKPMINKITLKSNFSTYERSRVQRWKMAIEEITANPFLGKGMGWLSNIEKGSSTNWYLFLTVESGLIGITPFIVFLLLSLRRMLKSKVIAKTYFLIGFIAAVLHFNVISTIHHPFLWVLLAIFCIADKQCGRGNAVAE